MLPHSHLYPHTPLILGHRGASAHAPENTLAAFSRALAQGADGLELDVTLSADDVPVVIHDDTLERTTDGRGAVHRHTVAELKRLDAGRWFGARFAGERLPTLAEVLAAYGRAPLYNVELKQDPSAEGQLARAVVALVQEYRLLDRVILSSFFLDNLRRVQAAEPGLPLGLLYDPTGPLNIVRALAAPGVRPAAHHPYFRLLNANVVRWLHARGWRVNTWTVNSERELRQMIDAGVDAIITNYPDRAVALTGRRRTLP